MAPKTEKDPEWFDTEGTFAQVDDLPGGDAYEARVEAALEELAMTGHEGAKVKIKERPAGTTHQVSPHQPVQVPGDYRMFTEDIVHLRRIKGGKGRQQGPALYELLDDSMRLYLNGRSATYPIETRLYAPSAHAVGEHAKPRK